MIKITKSILIACTILLTVSSCEAQSKVVVNREVETKNDGKMLLGLQTMDKFLEEPYASWYNKEYENYQVDATSIEQLKKEKLGSYQIIAMIGTWCGDSHREFPRLIKILDELKYPKDKIKIIALNRKKESPNGEEGQYIIQHVPTFILKKYGKEVGRIVEFPKTGYIERDLLEITKKQDTSVRGLFKK